MIQYINLILNICIISYLIKPYFPFYVSIDRTMWMRKLYAIHLMYITHKDKYCTSSKGIFTIFIRNPDKTLKWDSECFHNGKFKEKLNKASSK